MKEAAPGRWLVVGACVIVIATIAAAVVVMGGPSAQRQARMDERRVHDLERIVQAIARHAEAKQKLPVDLQSLAAQPGLDLAIVDPVDRSPYSYRITGNRTYRLCAVFATDTALTADAGNWTDDAWSHGVGSHCFDRRAKPLAASVR